MHATITETIRRSYGTEYRLDVTKGNRTRKVYVAINNDGSTHTAVWGNGNTPLKGHNNYRQAALDAINN